MAQWQTLSAVARPTAGKAVLGLGLVVLSAEFSQAGCPLAEVFGAAVRIVLGVLPSLVVAACQALQGCGCEHAGAWGGLLQIAGSCWPVILHLAGVA
ncbi:MAG TPA: hypothetical protein VE263_08450 [Candidatus Angelobacter sp.]|nr:hypothetical protein [Candidatus Angelobacter sp.]